MFLNNSELHLFFVVYLYLNNNLVTTEQISSMFVSYWNNITLKLQLSKGSIFWSANVVSQYSETPQKANTSVKTKPLLGAKQHDTRIAWKTVKRAERPGLPACLSTVLSIIRLYCNHRHCPDVHHLYGCASDCLITRYVVFGKIHAFSFQEIRLFFSYKILATIIWSHPFQ